MGDMHKKILVIDDEKDLLEEVSALLTDYGYQVSTASSGREGLEKAIQEKPDLILLDVVMPKMDGWQVLQRLKGDEATRATPVLMLTAKGELGSIFESQRLRATDHLIKPFEIEELVSFIRRYMG
jgi:DNA-binding response OmpR family regulator